jgi:phosphoserine phosphatase
MCDQSNIELSNTLTIGDGENDICMTKKAGIGISFCATHPTMNLVADFIVSERDMENIIHLIN